MGKGHFSYLFSFLVACISVSCASTASTSQAEDTVTLDQDSLRPDLGQSPQDGLETNTVAPKDELKVICPPLFVDMPDDNEVFKFFRRQNRDIGCGPMR